MDSIFKRKVNMHAINMARIMDLKKKIMREFKSMLLRHSASQL